MPTPVHFQFGSMPFTFCQQCLAGLPQRGESAAQLQVCPTQVHPNDPPTYSVRGPLTSSHSSLLTQAHLGCRCVHTLPVRIDAFHFLSAVSSWSATRRRKLSPPSSFGKRSASQRCVSAFATLDCAVNRRCPGTVTWGCAINRRPGS